jgi:hypothetical protein
MTGGEEVQWRVEARLFKDPASDICRKKQAEIIKHLEALTFLSQFLEKL